MLHYHGTPCGGEREQVTRFLAGRHAFVSFARPEDIGAAAEVCQSFAIDNGAFTAWKSGKPITDWSGYYAFCELWLAHPSCDWAIIPDVIDGDESDNDALLREWDSVMKDDFHSHGVPVWHLHESLERLETLVAQWPRVALGSSGRWARVGTESWWDRIAEAMTVACDSDGRPRCKLHGLRMLDPAVFHRLPLSSADSTNAVRNGCGTSRFGMYVPPTLSQRQDVIAARIEQHNSAAIWEAPQRQTTLGLLWGDA